SVFSLVKRFRPSMPCAMMVKPSTASFAPGLAEGPRAVVESRTDDDHEPPRRSPMPGDLFQSRASSPSAAILRPEPGRTGDRLDRGNQNDGDLRSAGPAAAVRVSVVHRRVRLDLR